MINCSYEQTARKKIVQMLVMCYNGKYVSTKDLYNL